MWLRNVKILKKDVVDVGVGVDSAFWGGRRFHEPVAITPQVAGPFGCHSTEIANDVGGVDNTVL